MCVPVLEETATTSVPGLFAVLGSALEVISLPFKGKGGSPR